MLQGKYIARPIEAVSPNTEKNFEENKKKIEEKRKEKKKKLQDEFKFNFI